MTSFFSPRLNGGIKVLVVPVTVILAITAFGTFFFFRGQQIMESQLRKQLSTTAAVAALQFDSTLVEQVHGPDDEVKPVYWELVAKLHGLKLTAPNVRFAYIMRRTKDPNQLAFVADADALSSVAEVDVNRNGIIDEDEEPSYPGDLYDISGAPALQREAFIEPTTDPVITTDQWGNLMSGYAPIQDGSGRTVAILGIDMRADEFIALSRSVFSPLTLLLVIVAGCGIATYVGYIAWSRRMQALNQLENERTALLDLASHQLGGPLTMFKWWLEILREQENGKFCEKNGICEQMQHGIDRMDSIIESLRAAAKLHKGTFAYRAQRSLLSPIIEEAVGQARDVMRMRHQQFDLSLGTDLPAVNVDPELLVGVLQELLDNASTYSPEGAHIALRAKSAQGGVLIEVEDSGHGIPAKDLPHIFEKFRRGSNAMLYKPVGNGLGLSIASGIVRRAKGKMWVRSLEEKGTVFSIQLPAA